MTARSAAPRTRQPSGIEIGGQYAAEARAKAAYALDVPAADGAAGAEDVPAADGAAGAEDVPADAAAEPGAAYTFPASRLGEARDRIAKANRRLERAGIGERFAFTSREYLAPDTSPYAPPGAQTAMAELRLSAPALSFGGWEFVATLVHEEAGAVARTVPGRSLEGWTPPAGRECDHCHTGRARRDTYVVRHAGTPGEPGTGEVRQVGSNCLAAFLGVKPAGLWALGYDLDLSAASDGESDAGGYPCDSRVPVREVIAYALAASDMGARFLSVAAAEYSGTSTVDAVRSMFWGNAEARAAYAGQLAAVGGIGAGEVDEVLASARGVGGDGDYAANMRLLADSENIDTRNMGLLVSAVGAWNRDRRRAAEREAAGAIAPGFLAPEGAKIAGVAATVTDAFRKSNFRGDGEDTVITMVDAATGHQVKWFASGPHKYARGDKVVIARATVKRHSSWRGTDETVITRAKMALAGLPAQGQGS